MDPGDPGLVDRTGSPRIATADPVGKVVRISWQVVPPLLDMVVVHEMAHAVSTENGIHGSVEAEEMAAGVIERHGLEIFALASESLGRPVCVRGMCL